jgi:hypothetical protein
MGGKIGGIGLQCVSFLSPDAVGLRVRGLKSCLQKIRGCVAAPPRSGIFRNVLRSISLVFPMILVAGCSSVSTQPRTTQSGTIQAWSTPPGTMLVSVKGWVEKPGDYALPVHANIGEALQAAGGFWDIGQPSTLRVERLADGHLQNFSVPLHDVNGKPQAAFELAPWDIIYADETFKWSTNALNAKLIPEKNAKPAILSAHARVTGPANQQVSEILKLVGRFPGVGHEVSGVHFLWSAAEVRVNDAIIGFSFGDAGKLAIAYVIRTDTHPNHVYLAQVGADDSSVDAINQRLAPEQESKPAKLYHGGVMTGPHSANDVSEILEIVGRYPRVVPMVTRIEFLHLKAEVNMGANDILGFQKEASGHWKLIYALHFEI